MAESPAPSGDNLSAQSTETHAPTGELSSPRSTEVDAPTGDLPTPQLAETHPPTGGLPSPRLVRIHVLCPSLPTPNRFTINSFPLSSTVEQLRSRITELVPSHPLPPAQRLIFRGKLLPHGHTTISDILGPLDGVEITIHLVLPVDQRPVKRPFRSFGYSSQDMHNIPRPSESRPSEPQSSEPQSSEPQSSEPQSSDLPSSTARESPSNLPRQRLSGSTGNGVTADLRTWALAQGEVAPLSRDRPSLEEIETMMPEIQDDLLHINNLLDANILPSTESLFQLQIQAQQIQEVLELNSPRDPDDRWGWYSSVQLRILYAFRRIDRLVASAVPLHFYRNTRRPDHNLPELYFIAARDGFSGLVVPQDTTLGTTPFEAASGVHQAQAAFVNGANPAAPVNAANPAVPGQGPAMVDNLVRRAVRNQQQQRNNAGGLTRHFRRLVRFMSLYALCANFTEGATWTRTILLTVSVLIALFSETTFARDINDMVFERAQLHLERLAHVGGLAGQPAARQEQNNGQAGDRPTDGILAETWVSLRRLERAIVLLLASLVPGVGERQVQAQRAAEEAERARQAEQAEQAEQQQRERAQEQAQGDQTPASAPENAGAGNDQAH